MELNLLIAILVILVLGILFIAWKLSSNSSAVTEERLKQEIQGQLGLLKQDIYSNIQMVNGIVSDGISKNGSQNMQAVEGIGKQLQENQRLATTAQEEQIEQLKEQFESLRLSLNREMQDFRQNILDQVGLMEKSITEKQGGLQSGVSQQVKELREGLVAQNGVLEASLNKQMEVFRSTVTGQIEKLETDNASQQKQLRENVNTQMQQFSSQMSDQAKNMEGRMEKLEKSNEAKLESMTKAMGESMKEMRTENTKQLEQIRGTVDEKLQDTLEKRISESFKAVSTQLEQVYKGLGEMQTLASDVGGLKKVLSGVKTRGNLGEYQLAAILSEILSPEQYDTNVVTVPRSKNRVEFAIKLPHEDGIVYLPIDSKFPAETYEQLKDAQESGDRAAVEAAYKRLETVIKSEANDIKTKYISVPSTTKFAIMFLPVEGLYAEVVSRGMVEVLQRDYNINVAGPSTMAALLNSLQMGFKTLALQKKSNKAWEVLGAVKTEFEKFGEGLRKMQTHLNKTSSELDSLITTRTNKMNSKLKEVEKLDDIASRTVLELDSPIVYDEE